MAYINVEYSKFESAAVAVDNYITTVKNKMRDIQGDVDTLSSSWQGGDYNQFKKEFDKVDSDGSTYKQMVKAMESYARYIRYAAEEYRKAKTRAVDRANSLK